MAYVLLHVEADGKCQTSVHKHLETIHRLLPVPEPIQGVGLPTGQHTGGHDPYQAGPLVHGAGPHIPQFPQRHLCLWIDVKFHMLKEGKYEIHLMPR